MFRIFIDRFVVGCRPFRRLRNLYDDVITSEFPFIPRCYVILGLAPQALCLRPLRGLLTYVFSKYRLAN